MYIQINNITMPNTLIRQKMAEIATSNLKGKALENALAELQNVGAEGREEDVTLATKKHKK